MVEKHFGIQRQLGRRNDNPDIKKLDYNNNTIHKDVLHFQKYTRKI